MNIPLCTKPWTRMYITSDGNCWNCCYQVRPFYNVQKNSPPFEDVWNSENIKYIRDKLLNNEMPTRFCDCLNKRGSIPPDDKIPDCNFVESIQHNLVQLNVTTPPKDYHKIQREDPRDRFIKYIVKDNSFVDIGGLFGTINEKVSVAHQYGASSLSIIDSMPINDPLWVSFFERTKNLAKPIYCMPQNYMEVNLQFDVVHCSGVIYHQPDFYGSIEKLHKMSNKFVIVSSVVIPEHIVTKSGSLTINEFLYVPDLSVNDLNILSEYWIKNTGANNAIGINTPSNFTPNNLAAFWWMPTISYFKKTVEQIGLHVLDEDYFWEKNAYCLLAEKV